MVQDNRCRAALQAILNIAPPGPQAAGLSPHIRAAELARHQHSHYHQKFCTVQGPVSLVDILAKFSRLTPQLRVGWRLASENSGAQSCAPHECKDFSREIDLLFSRHYQPYVGTFTANANLLLLHNLPADISLRISFSYEIHFGPCLSCIH